MKNIRFIIFAVIVLSCNKNIVNNNVIQNTNNLEIIEFINNNKSEIINTISYKAIYDLFFIHEEQKSYFNKRIDYFLAILTNDNELINKRKKEYIEEAYIFYNTIPEKREEYYLKVRRIFDIQLIILLKENFGEIMLPIDYLFDYYDYNFDRIMFLK